MNPLGLSPDAHERRRKFVTASDAKRIVEGDWPALYREKMGLAQPDNLDDELRVQMGSFTEPFNLFWYMKQTGRSVVYHSDNEVNCVAWKALTGQDAFPEFVASEEYPFMGCSLDAVSFDAGNVFAVLDAKHVGQFRYDELVERYTPAMTHQAIVKKMDRWELSVFVANGRWERVEQNLDVFFAEDLIEKEREFMSWVERGEEPPFMGEPPPLPKPQPRLRNIEMPADFSAPEWATFCARNNWAADAANAMLQFAETDGAQKANGAAREDIKKLIPDDCGLLTRLTKFGWVSAKRSTSNAITITLKKEKTDG